jgi:hypothetical protein
MLKGTIQRSADLLRVLTNLYVPKNDDDRFPELKELCETIKTMLNTDYLDRGFALKMSFCEVPDGLYASLGETGVMQVFHVLLQNCHESFSGVNDRSQEVCIVSEYLEDTIKFSISDNGSGIPQSHLPKIFDLFFTTKGSLGGQIVGNKRTERGLGLSLLEGLLRDCGGSIKVESLEGQGTSVTLYIPVGTSSALLGEGELSITEEGRSLNEPLNIVLFHDQPMDSQILLRFLELQGQSVEVVCNLEDLKQHNFCDVLFLNHSCLNECQMAAAQMTTQVPDAFEVVYFVNGTEDSLLPSKEGKTWKVMKKPLNFAYLTRLLNRIRYSPVFSRY